MFLRLSLIFCFFSWLELFSAMIAGAIVGFERQLSCKPIDISTCAFATFSSINREPTLNHRVVSQIITGIGFLGGGVILSRNGIVIGVTSAPCIWLLADIGITFGTNHPATSI